jgi:hypothetical protein
LCIIMPPLVTVNFTLPAGTSLWLSWIPHSISVALTSVVAPALCAAGVWVGATELPEPIEVGVSVIMMSGGWVAADCDWDVSVVAVAATCAGGGFVAASPPQAVKPIMPMSANVLMIAMRPIVLEKGPLFLIAFTMNILLLFVMPTR